MTLPFVLAAVAFVALVALVVRQRAQTALRRIPRATEAAIEEVLSPYEQQIVEYRNCVLRKAEAVRHVDLYLVVPGQMTLRRAQHLRRLISEQVDHRLGGGSVLVHIEPCRLDCSSCRKQDRPRRCLPHPQDTVAAPVDLRACPYRQ